MPTMSNYLLFSYVNLAFVIQIGLMMYFKSVKEIKDNWQEYRCNPPYWVFSDDLSTDFNYCVQNSQTSLMGFLLQPMTYMLSSITSMSGDASEAVNNARGMISKLRDFLTNIIQTVFGVFFNMIIEFQRMIIAIIDMVGKIVGVISTLLLVLDGTMKTMLSAWNGPAGQLVRSIGSCFHPDTKVKLKNGDIFPMKDLPLGAELEDGAKIFAVLKIDNSNKDKLYKIKGGVNDEDIFVTGKHFIQDKKQDKFIYVKDFENTIIQEEITCDWFSCLITTNRRIPIGQHIFWDWEDDELSNKINFTQ
jgi:hypothetical protein